MKNDFRTKTKKVFYLWCIAWILFLMGSANPTSASPLQNRTVTGTVTSGTDGEALIGGQCTNTGKTCSGNNH